MSPPAAYHPGVPAAELLSVRADVWTWAVRLFPSRAAAKAACAAGRVRVGDTVAKPAHPVRVGDTVRARTPAGDRVLVVTGVIARRVAAPVAVTLYEDHSPPPPPRLERPAIRDRGSGRPTKRERRQLDRLRGTDR
jgi:ribosome-associated heat shock protein Hsp15